jgi:energy-coupling factor transporter ATP-binding protein EcfA2
MPTTSPVTTFTWAIANLERETDDGFVMTAHYTVNANDGTYSSGAYGSVGFQRPDNLIPYNQLQEETVIGWVKEALGGDEKVAEIEAALQAQIDEQRHPSKAAGVPWAS